MDLQESPGEWLGDNVYTGMVGGWDNSVRGLKDPLLEVTAENLRKLIFPYDTEMTSKLTMSGLPDQFEILVSHHDRPMGEKIIVSKGNDMQEN